MAMPPSALRSPFDPQRREGERARVMMIASIRERGTTAHNAVINDLSRQGCQVSNIFLRAGKPVWVKFGQLAPIEGMVMWARSDQCGIRFNQALHPAVLDHVAAAARVR
ncbi:MULTISPECIES: PilZ domain-containing protein [Sphingomonas]|uniref:PilZ domain-containing protein n=1 Tax=Sphingomonas TaxID=13687 RepID=UPI00083572D5|nr:PilZ domain-containing protein [Sphingomonas sp. CCH10-B3]MBA3880502.1 PilZ domain-containing protein [Sphingobium sp.]